MTLPDDIIEDVRHFADPYSEVLCVSSGSDHELRWSSRRRELSATFRQTDAGLLVQFAGAERSYAQFLAHEDVGNLTYLAENTVRQFETTKRVPSDITTKAAGDDGSPRAAHEVIDTSITAHQDNGTTHVAFLAAQGGSGKTKVLERLVLDGARRFASGRAHFLYFYVNAQGRALAQVDEAFAVELDLLGAHLSFSAIAALTRAGALVPVIDGFDELIGAVGYDEAFQSLGRFLDALRGAGQLVAAARSTYYEREFQARVRLKTQRDRWSLDTITLQPWGVDERHAAVQLAEQERISAGLTVDPDASRRARDQLGVRAEALGDLFGRPFFAVQAARAILAGETIQEEGDLLRRLTEALIRREVTEKFLDRNHVSMTTLPQVWTFLREVASELWYQQTRSLDGPSLDAVVSVATEGWQPLAIDRLRERVRDLPVFSSADAGRIEFAHEYFFGLFLAEILRTALTAGGYDLENALGRGLLPEGVAHQVAIEPHAPHDVFERLNAATAADALKSALIRENAGTIAAAVLCAHRGAVDSLTANRMVFGNVALAGKIAVFDCTECMFRRTDLTRLEVAAGDWSGAQLDLAAVRPGTTILRVKGLIVGGNVRGLSVRREAEVDVWDPVGLATALREIHVPLPEQATARSVEDSVVQVVQRLARAFLKSVFVASEDDVNAAFMRSEAWPRVLAALERHGLVLPEQRAASGRPKTFYRCQMDPDELMVGLSPNAKVDRRVRAFWDEVSR